MEKYFILFLLSISNVGLADEPTGDFQIISEIDLTLHDLENLRVGSPFSAGDEERAARDRVIRDVLMPHFIESMRQECLADNLSTEREGELACSNDDCRLNYLIESAPGRRTEFELYAAGNEDEVKLGFNFSFKFGPRQRRVLTCYDPALLPSIRSIETQLYTGFDILPVTR
ncbi:MAG: hypothetical protein HRU19_19305 [Pseudobacteriovorax sp.]|nr:hypothetical protein [Pseudobacteriovorax sp.]